MFTDVEHVQTPACHLSRGDAASPVGPHSRPTRSPGALQPSGGGAISEPEAQQGEIRACSVLLPSVARHLPRWWWSLDARTAF